MGYKLSDEVLRNAMLIVEQEEIKEYCKDKDGTPDKGGMSDKVFFDKVEEGLYKKIEGYEIKRAYRKSKRILRTKIYLLIFCMLVLSFLVKPVQAWCSMLVDYIVQSDEKDMNIYNYSLNGKYVDKEMEAFELGYVPQGFKLMEHTTDGGIVDYYIYEKQGKNGRVWLSANKFIIRDNSSRSANNQYDYERIVKLRGQNMRIMYQYIEADDRVKVSAQWKEGQYEYFVCMNYESCIWDDIETDTEELINVIENIK